jgi:uncharacterized protein (TIGR02453 family)
MKTVAINNSTLKFLSDIAQNNNRDWFHTNKDFYLEAQGNMVSFIDTLVLEMSKHDQLENNSAKKSLYRIYSDMRFSKDKLPYHSKFDFGLKRSSKQRRGGYYMNIKPGNSYLACGFFAPNPEDLKKIRLDITENYTKWYALLESETIQSNFGDLKGNGVLTTPRGFQKDHVAIELIRHKQFYLRHDFTDQEVLSSYFLTKVNSTYQSIRPFFDYMSELLTTDSNGETII